MKTRKKFKIFKIEWDSSVVLDEANVAWSLKQYFYDNFEVTELETFTILPRLLRWVKK